MTSNTSYLKGTCLTMCPKNEILMREKNSLVHILEADETMLPPGELCEIKKYKVRADPTRMVKSFQRSAAGKEMIHPEDLRPVNVLKITVDYLLNEVINVTRFKWNIVYSFITDRLRSVRQDMIIQQPPNKQCIEILEPMVRFLIYSSYRLCEEKIEIFDPKLNGNQLSECLSILQSKYDEDNINTRSRWEMEAVILIYNIDDNYLLSRALYLHNVNDITFDVALAISFLWIRNDYVTICRLLHKLPLLCQMALTMQLPKIRRKALQTMNSAYSSKNLTYPLSNLSKLLLFNNDTESADECKYYNLRVEDGKIHFLKGSFNSSSNLASVKKLSGIENILKEADLSQVLLKGHS